jgi:subtilisin-like proprotein convertase family protein
MKFVRFCAVVLAAVAVSSAQTNVYVDDANPATGTTNTFPFGQANGFTTLHFYTAKQLHAAGVTPFQVLTDLAVAPISTGTYNAPTAQVLIGHVLGTPLPGAWTTTLDTPAIVHDLTYGPYTFPYVAAAWTSLPGVAAAGFTWDGQRDVGVFITTSPGVTGTFTARRSSTNFRYAVTTFGATTQTPTSTGYFAMKARLTFTGNPPQQNTPEATFTMNGAPGLSLMDGGDTVDFSISSTTAATMPFILAVSPNLTGGHLPLTGQTFDLGFPGFGLSDVFLVGPGVFVPLSSGALTFFGALDGAGAANFSVPLPCLVGIGQTYAQAVIVDASHPDGIRTTGAPSFASKATCRYPFAGTPTGIPDTNTPTSFTVNVPAGMPIFDLDLVLDWTHVNYTDLVVTLSQAGGPTITLKDATTVDITDMNGRFRFTDEALMTLDQAALLCTTAMSDGAYQGDAALSAFDGLDAGGVWTLTITDAVGGNAGNLAGAALVFNGLE